MVDALVINQHAIGTTVLGMATMESSLRQGLSGTAVNADFVQLPRWTRWDRVRARPFGSGRTELDLHEFRWHCVESGRAHAVVRRATRRRTFDALYVNSHSAGLRMNRLMQQMPTLLAVDCTVARWSELSALGRTAQGRSVAILPSSLLERRAFTNAAAVVAMSRWTADQVRAASPTARCEVIHPGLDLSLYRPGPARGENRVKRVLFVGGRFRAKGGEDLLCAMAHRLGDDVVCDLVSGDDVGSRPGTRGHRLSSGSKELISLFQAADVLVLPSYMDAVPWVVLEAMACGTPVVCSTVGAAGELVSHGECGTVIAPGDVPRLRAAIESIIDHPQRRDIMGAAGRRRAQEDFDVIKQGARLAALFQDVSAGATPRTSSACA